MTIASTLGRTDSTVGRRLHYLSRLALLIFAYALTAKIILSYFAANHVISIVWPSSGIALAALMLGGKRYWPGIFIGAALGNFLGGADNPWWVCLGIATGNTLEALAAYGLLTRYFRVVSSFDYPRDFVFLGITSASCSLISASIGVGMLYTASFIPTEAILQGVLRWWQGDVLGMIIFAPLIVLCTIKSDRTITKMQVLHIVLCFGVAFLCGQGIFLGWFDEWFTIHAKPYWMFVFVTWAAVAFSRRGVLLIVCMVLIQALVGIFAGTGISFIDLSSVEIKLASLWFYLIALTIVGITPALMINARRRVENALRESEERWQFALEGAEDGVWDWDIPADKVFLSSRFRKMYGYPDEHVDANPEAWSELVHPEDMSAVLHDFEEHLAGKTHAYRNEHRVRCFDGSYKWILDRGKVVRLDNKGKPVRMVGTHTDISQRKEAEQALLLLNDSLEERVATRTAELAQAKEQAESATLAKSEFLANMSHEIRTPISSVLGLTHLALRGNPDPRMQDYLEKILLSGKHLLGLIDNILDFSKIEAGRIVFQNRLFTLESVLENVRVMFEVQAKNKGIVLVTDSSSITHDQFYGDPLRLGQILINYVNNAIKFSDSGVIKVHIYPVESTDESMLLHVDVFDNGIGIEEREKQFLFQSFQQVDTGMARRYGGTGLGLAISKQLAEMMGGEVGVSSTLGQGSCFWFTVRLDKVYTGPGEYPISRRTHPRGSEADYSATIKGSRILLVEDNPLNQQVACELLEHSGASVRVLDNGSEVVQVLLAEPFDCVLMDMQMPVMDGLEATRLIRAEPTLQKIPVIAMTANAWNEDRQRCLAAGMSDFLGKPVRPSQLLALLARWLDDKNDNTASVEEEPTADALTVDALTVDKRTGRDETSPLLIDLSILQDAFPEDPSIVAGIVGKFIDMTSNDIQSMQVHLDAQDLDSLNHLGHKLKSSSRQLGAAYFGELCEQLEHTTSFSTAAKLVAELQVLLPVIISQMRQATG